MSRRCPLLSLLLLAAIACSGSSISSRVIFVAPHGSDTTGDGTTNASAFATCAKAVAVLTALPTPLPVGGVEVNFAAGTYALTTATACGTIAGLRGTAHSPVVFRGATATGGAAGTSTGITGGTTFDATSSLNASQLRPVSNVSVAALVNPAAKGKLLELYLPPDVPWSGGGGLEWNGTPLFASVWPNEGLGYVRRVFDQGAVYAEGRTKGPKPHCHVCLGTNKSTAAAPCGANVSLAEQPGGDWEAELAAGPGFGGGVAISGYFSNDWYHETHHVARVVRSPTNMSVQFASFSRYGICEALEPGAKVGVNAGGGGCGGSAPGRFTVSGLLSEVDVPGEYFFNAATRMLYLYPLESMVLNYTANRKGRTPFDVGVDVNAASPRLGFRAGPGLVVLSDSTGVTLRDVSVVGSTGTAVSITGGANNTVGGLTISSSAGGVSIAGGYGHRVVGNDIYDVGSHIDSTGNAADGLHDLVPTNTVIANNHLTQVYERGAWSLRIRGMGDRFSHNLVHDSAGQLLLPGGPLSMVDHNEIFNTGYQEGDGGVVYSGASLTAGYGMQYRENFIHHSMEVPGLHGRGGIYFDDHEGSVSNCSGNVMYKAAGRAFLVNGGAANNITRNLIINGGVAIYNQHADDMTRDLPLYDNGTLKRGDKGDYIWKTEQSLGVPDFASIFDTPLARRFPTFARLLAVNSSTSGWASAAHSNFQRNVFLNNSANVCLLHSYHPPGNELCDGDLPKPGSPGAFIDDTGSVEAQWGWFPPGAAQSLAFANASLGFDTETMGLRCDEWRRSRPAPSLYRPWVQSYFHGIPSAAAGPYTPEAASLRAGLQSGRALVLNFTRPCPVPAVRVDCEGVWLAWGECEADGQQVWRWTVEVDAAGGGKGCVHRDGFAQRRGC